MFKIRNLAQSDISSFERELELISSLKHPNIISFYGIVLENNKVGIVMELCELGSLSKYLIKNRGKIVFREKMKLLLNIARGMAYLHAKGIIHRDLKCDNVLIDTNMVPKITDFGVSTLVQHQRAVRTLNVGTSCYMAPECVLDENYNEKCDVFSFGIMMFEILCETLKPYGSNISLNLEMRVAKNPLFRPVLPENVEVAPAQLFYIKLMQQCWSHLPQDRPSFDSIIETLEGKLISEQE